MDNCVVIETSHFQGPTVFSAAVEVNEDFKVLQTIPTGVSTFAD